MKNLPSPIKAETHDDGKGPATEPPTLADGANDEGKKADAPTPLGDATPKEDANMNRSTTPNEDAGKGRDAPPVTNANTEAETPRMTARQPDAPGVDANHIPEGGNRPSRSIRRIPRRRPTRIKTNRPGYSLRRRALTTLVRGGT